MQTLLEDYKRRLKTAETMLKENLFNGNNISRTRIETKAAEYRSFIVEIERAIERQKQLELQKNKKHSTCGICDNPVIEGVYTCKMCLDRLEKAKLTYNKKLSTKSF